MSASRQVTLRDAGFSGGSWWRLTRQRIVILLRHAAAAAAPDANANISHRRRCTPKSFPSNTSGNQCNARCGSESDVGDRRRLRRPQGGADGRSDLDLDPGPSESGANRSPHIGAPNGPASAAPTLGVRCPSN
jgi:hypothetical protein